MINILTSCFLLTGSTFAGIQDGLLLYYNFDEPSDLGRDTSGWNRHAQGSDLTSAPGQTGKGVYFGGSGRLTTPSFENTQWTTPISVSAWFFLTGPQMDYGTIIASGFGDHAAFLLRVSPENSGRHAYVRVASIMGATGVDAKTPQVPIREWTHLCFTYDGQSVRLYLNGTLQPTETMDGGPFLDLRSPLTIGWGGTTAPRPLTINGVIDEVRIYNRVISHQELTQLAAKENSVMPAQQNPSPQTTPPPIVSKPQVTSLSNLPAEENNSLPPTSPPVSSPQTAAINAEPPATPAQAPAPSPAPAQSVPASSPEAQYCPTLIELILDWKSGHREKAILELDRLSRTYAPE